MFSMPFSKASVLKEMLSPPRIIRPLESRVVQSVARSRLLHCLAAFDLRFHATLWMTLFTFTRSLFHDHHFPHFRLETVQQQTIVVDTGFQFARI